MLIYPALVGLEKYRPKFSFVFLDKGHFTIQDLSGVKNLVAALFQLESSRSDDDIRNVVCKSTELAELCGTRQFKKGIYRLVKSGATTPKITRYRFY